MIGRYTKYVLSSAQLCVHVCVHFEFVCVWWRALGPVHLCVACICLTAACMELLATLLQRLKGCFTTKAIMVALFTLFIITTVYSIYIGENEFRPCRTSTAGGDELARDLYPSKSYDLIPASSSRIRYVSFTF